MLSVRKYAGLFVLPDHSKNRLMSFTPAGFLLHLRIFLFPLKIEEEAGIQHDAHSGRSGRGQTDHGQAGVGLDAHDVSHRQADQKGPCTMTQTVLLLPLKQPAMLNSTAVTIVSGAKPRR